MPTREGCIMEHTPRYYSTPDACSCPDWQYRGRLRPCKHVRALRQAIDLVDRQYQYNKERHVQLQPSR